MNRLIKALVVVSATVIWLDTANLMAQTSGGNRRNQAAQGNANGGGRGNRANFDPAQAQQRRLEQIKETLGVTNDDEWKVIEERLQKVLDAQRESRMGGMGMGGMGGRRGGGGPGGNNQDPNANANIQRRGGMGGQPNPAVTELEKALDDNAASEVVAAKLASLRDARKTAESKLEAAQAELQKIVTRKQEARLVLMGLLK